MDSNLESPPADSEDAKTAFRKPSSDKANRKYRRRSPVSGSPSDGSPMHEHSSSPKFPREDPGKVSEYRTRKRDDGRELERDSDRNCYGRSSDFYRHSDRHSSRSSHGYYRQDDYIKGDIRADEEKRNYQKLSSRHSDHSRSREYSRHLDRYSRDKYDGSGYRSKDKDRESSFPEHQKYKDKDSSSERVGSGRRHGHFEEMEREQDRHALGREVQDEKKDYRRNFTYEESKGQRSDSVFRRDEGKHRIKEGYKSGLKEMDNENLSSEQRDKHDDKETNRSSRIIREPTERPADKDILRSENQESNAKRSKLFSSEKDTDGRKHVSKFTTTADGRESSSFNQVQEGKMTIGKTQANDVEAANDINAAKVAAMKAAELVNKNLVSVGPGGCMTADQKKKLLWGNKKNTTAEEAGHRWDTALFSDRERQEKFNKLMSLRLPWCLWPIVGCEGRSKGGTQTKQRRWWRTYPNREAERTPTGFREAIHCWTAKKRWPYCWIRPLSSLTFFRNVKTSAYSVVLLRRSHVSCDSVVAHGRDNILFLLGVHVAGRKTVAQGNLTMCKVRKLGLQYAGYELKLHFPIVFQPPGFICISARVCFTRYQAIYICMKFDCISVGITFARSVYLGARHKKLVYNPEAL